MEKREKIEAATFQRIVQHLRNNPDVQNIDLMNLADFCRNCIVQEIMDSNNNIPNCSYSCK